MLDFDSLRLTAEERLEAIDGEMDVGIVVSRALTDAQLTKALWGIQEWLTKASADPKGYTLKAALVELNSLLTKDYPKPEES